MNSFYLFATVFILLIIQGISLFATTPLHNFVIGYFSLSSKRIALDGTGTKFVIWNDKGEILMFGINGLPLCSKNITQSIKSIIWPEYYAPIILYDEGQTFATLSEFTCTPIKTYDMAIITGVSNERAQSLSFMRVYNYPQVIASGLIGAYQIDLNTSRLTSIYSTNDPTLPLINKTINVNRYLYLSMIDKTKISYVRIWDIFFAKQPIKQIPFNDTVIFDIKSSMDNVSMVTQGYPLTNPNYTVIHSFDNSGKVKTNVIIINNGPSQLITDGNMFDCAVFFNIARSSLSVVRINDGVSLQTISNPQIYGNFTTDYQARVLVILDDYRRVMTYSYENDKPQLLQ